MVLTGFDTFRFVYGETRRTVYRRGDGPGVVIVHEVPGITPEVTRFARRVVDAGFTELGDLVLDQSGALPRQQRFRRFHALRLAGGEEDGGDRHSVASAHSVRDRLSAEPIRLV